MNLKDKNLQEFKELISFVFNGEYEEIDKWFLKHKISRRPALERELTLNILNSTYFFSFRTLSTSLKEIDEQSTKREVAILKNLKCENQIRLFGIASIDEVNHRHFEVIKLTKKNKEILLNSSSVCAVFTKLFNQENFVELEKIEDLLKRPLLEQNSKGVTFHYKERSSRGTHYFNIDEPIFSPKYDIVFNYSDSKKHYLDKKGIFLPTIEDVDKVHMLILKNINERQNLWRIEDVEKINLAIKSYKIQKSYLDLSNNLGVTNKNHKKLKI